MNVRKLIIAFLIGISLYLLVNWMSIEGLLPPCIKMHRFLTNYRPEFGGQLKDKCIEYMAPNESKYTEYPGMKIGECPSNYKLYTNEYWTDAPPSAREEPLPDELSEECEKTGSKNCCKGVRKILARSKSTWRETTPCNQHQTNKHWYSPSTYVEPTIDVTLLDLDAGKYGYIRYYTDGGSTGDHFDWFKEMNPNLPQYAESVTNENIISILECLYSKYYIKSISVRKETCHRVSSGWAKYNYILNVRGHSGGGNAVFEWGDKDDNDTLEYVDEIEREMCYNFSGPLLKITFLK